MEDEKRCILRVIHATDGGDAPPTRMRRSTPSPIQERVARLKAKYVAGPSAASAWRAVHVLHKLN